MADTTTINITEEQHTRLKERKQHKNEAFADVVGRLLDEERPGEGEPVDVDDLKAVTATPKDLTALRSDLLERLDRIEDSAGVDADDVRVAVESGVENALPDGVGR